MPLTIRINSEGRGQPRDDYLHHSAALRSQRAALKLSEFQGLCYQGIVVGKPLMSAESSRVFIDKAQNVPWSTGRKMDDPLRLVVKVSDAYSTSGSPVPFPDAESLSVCLAAGRRLW